MILNIVIGLVIYAFLCGLYLFISQCVKYGCYSFFDVMLCFLCGWFLVPLFVLFGD